MIGTLRHAEGRLAQAFPGRNWPDRILSASQQYNDTVHSAHGLRPNDVSEENANSVFRKLFRPFAGLWRKKLGTVVRVGTPVRLRLTNRGAFAKANQPQNSEDIFVVGRIRLHPRYGLKYKLFSRPENFPIAGTYARGEIVPVRLPQI